MSSRLILALDVPSRDAALRLVDGLGDLVSFYKLGMWLLFEPGADALMADLQARGKQLFLDYKLHDISETVRHGAASIARRGVRFLTVHGEPPVMQAAVAGAAGSGLGILAVTVLTSLDDAALAEAGYGLGVSELVARRVSQAASAGCAGVIASAADHPDRLRDATGAHGLVFVTPGIRLPGDASGDQKRTCTPAEALRHGADYIVVGRPIVRAADPRAAAERVLADMHAGTADAALRPGEKTPAGPADRQNPPRCG